MKNLSTIYMGIILLLCTNVSWGQADSIQIRFIGNCGLHLSDDSLNLYIDFPYKSGAYNYMTYNESELDSIQNNAIFLFTHQHADHYSGKLVRRSLRHKNGLKITKWNIRKLDQLNERIPDFHVEAIETDHLFSFKHYAYLITWHGKRIYVYGDTEDPTIALSMTDLDWAFVPYWIAMELNKRQVRMDTKMLGVYHFYPHMKPVSGNPDKTKLLIHQGEIIYLPY